MLNYVAFDSFSLREKVAEGRMKVSSRMIIIKIDDRLHANSKAGGDVALELIDDVILLGNREEK